MVLVEMSEIYQVYIFALTFNTLWANSANDILMVQSNLNRSNTDGSFSMANSNSFWGSYKIPPIAQENKYFFLFYHEIVCCVYS